jgi:hypothetical protein
MREIDMTKLIERNTLTGDYNLPKQEMIVELGDGRRVYLIEGFGGMSSLEGGTAGGTERQCKSSPHPRQFGRGLGGVSR